MMYTPRDRLKDHHSETELYLNRTVFSLVFVLILMGVLITRMVYLQISKHQQYLTSSDKNRLSIIYDAPTRGLIYDRNGILLAENRPSFSLEIVPEQVDDIDLMLEQLSQLISISDKDKKAFFKEKRSSRRFKKIPLKQKLSEQEVAVFSANKHLFKGASIEARLQRFYPYGEALTHVLGYVKRISDQDLARIDESNYKATHNIGKLGLERFYENELHGTIGYRYVETDALGRVVNGPLKEHPPQPGASLVLHLDIQLQLAAEAALNGRRGAVVALDPRNGGVLALVSNPSYDPNLFVTGIDSASYKELTTSIDKPLFNRALRGQYAPGSTIKPLIGLVGLAEKIVTPNTTITDFGWYTLPNDDHRYRDWKKYGHGKVSLAKAVYQSCDTYFYDLAYKLGIDRIHATMSQFGFGQRTGLDIGEEVSGLMPSREWKRDNKKQPWYPGETLNTGIGQGFWTATPLQIAHSIAILTQHGHGYKPRLVSTIMLSGQKHIVPPVPIESIDWVKADDVDTILHTMHDVVNHQHGTARKAFSGAPYESAGKTGTAQVISIAQDAVYDEDKIHARHRDNALYVGFAPFQNPDIVVAVILENAGHGGSAAAPIARAVMDQYLLHR